LSIRVFFTLGLGTSLGDGPALRGVKEEIKKKKKEKQMVKGREWSGVRGRGVPEGK
jgi:hypothetical protein